VSTVSSALVRDALARAGILTSARGVLPETFSTVVDDSRAVVPGALFVAVRGTARDGHDFLEAAEQRGMAAAIVEDPSRTVAPAFVVSDGRRAAAVAASAAYRDPARELTLVGVTGTNGKTTTAHMVRHLLDEDTAPAASIGTLGVLTRSAGDPFPGGSGLTTPGPIELQRVLRALVDAGVRRVAMEVSSHSLDQHRVDGVAFHAGVFTNLTRDHLDYHGTMEAYVAAKARLVDLLAPGAAAVVNADDSAWQALPAAPRLVRFGMQAADADVRSAHVRFSERGSAWTLLIAKRSADVRVPLLGEFNVANALAAAGTAWSLGQEIGQIARRLDTLPQVPGRLERLHDRPVVLRDYSHTPDSLERALRAVRPFTAGRLFVVVGCGGDRDPGKRPIMGGIAERLADVAVITSDNPRTEDPEHILDQMEAGMSRRDHVRIEDRREAIAHTLRSARSDDVVLLAGKGHETYQIRGTTSFPFDEKIVVRELVAELAS
jgi:UDP-N-acetylmuramoyl-L-alanyl-D-glutamate--2,6-diaminopimelate ligase